ncbi:MAG: cupin domain-containing protein [Candidatus Riflebacteria bacterium]|nr:cupin domain-containing protein [Candidatus Riflebacteria bacterium]
MEKMIVKKPTPQELEQLGVKKWGIWTCEPKTFDWSYDDKETCYILEGKATVKAKDHEISFGSGDLVIFPKGLSCIWTVRENIKKHYKFG